jgi:hypothetical protein
MVSWVPLLKATDNLHPPRLGEEGCGDVVAQWPNLNLLVVVRFENAMLPWLNLTVMDLLPLSRRCGPSLKVLVATSSVSSWVFKQGLDGS